MDLTQFQNVKTMQIRPRRNRVSPSIRGLVRETKLHVDDLILPLFLVEGEGINDQISSLPIAKRQSLDHILSEIKSCLNVGLRHFILFPAIPESLKDKTASYSYSSDNFYLKAASAIKEKYPNITLISDVAMDPYSSDGHDGLVKDGKILNDQTLPILARMSVAQAKAGFDIVGPSDMMDGRVGVIRDALDEANFQDVGIMSYTAKYASAFYGPFRDALDSAPKSGDKKTYQMDPANRIEAIREAELDIAEGADFIMVKPALHYLDIISDLKSSFDIPIAAYHVSGECSQILAAAKLGWLDLELAMHEAVTSIKRAGADCILTYFAKEIAKSL